MKVLFLVQKEQRVILDRFYDSICRHLGDCDLRWLTSNEQAELKSYFRNINVKSYDRIILFLRFKKEIKQARFIQTLPGLVILEHDAYQNYIEGKYRGLFSRHYKKMPWARVICSGYEVSEKFRVEGFDVKFVPKGYDQALLKNNHSKRNVELGFLGSTNSKAYSRRRELLEILSEHEDMVVARTNSGEDYCKALNGIKIFVGADVGFGEYMIKNFEAMACGCMLLVWDQGKKENSALGFKDMENVVVFSSIDGLRKKLLTLRSKPEEIKKIAQSGQRLVEDNFSWEILGYKVAEAVKIPLRKKIVKNCLGIKRYTWSID